MAVALAQPAQPELRRIDWRELMKKKNKVFLLIVSQCLCLYLLAGCQNVVATKSTTTLYTPTAITLPSETSTPLIKYQLTYISNCEYGFECMNAVDIGCLDTSTPCMGEQQVLFKIPGNEETPRIPIETASWSPDGKKVALEVVGEQGKMDIFVGDWNGKNWMNLTASPGYDEFNPNWSVDGKSVTYLAEFGDDASFIRVLSTNLMEQKTTQLLNPLTISFPFIEYIDWSPDGNRVVFTHSDGHGYEQIYLADIDGSNVRRITNRTESHFGPKFSPDGKWIMDNRDSVIGMAISNIYLLRVDGSDEHAITQDDIGLKWGQAWLPYGNWIAYTLSIENYSDIYLVDTDSLRQIRVTDHYGDETGPSWRIVLP